MIFIPTVDLCGILNDVTPFADPDPELPRHNCVHIRWDGEQIHTQTTDGYRAAWVTWTPGDLPPGVDKRQDDLTSRWDSVDTPWSTHVILDDVKKTASIFKLPTKEAIGVPLALDYNSSKDQLTVRRERDTGYSRIAITLDGQPTPTKGWIDIEQVLAEPGSMPWVPRTQVTCSADWLADYAKVRPYGPLRLSFHDNNLVLVRIGNTFRGCLKTVTE